MVCSLNAVRGCVLLISVILKVTCWFILLTTTALQYLATKVGLYESFLLRLSSCSIGLSTVFTKDLDKIALRRLFVIVSQILGDVMLAKKTCYT